jgi:replicative DNA helicase
VTATTGISDLLELRVPPHSTEAEQAIIGGVLLSQDSFDKVSWLRADAFYAHAHRLLWGAIARLTESGKPADMVTVCEALGDNLEKIGGAAYIAAICQSTPGVIHLNRYAELVRDKAILRDLARRGTEIAEKALAAGAEPKALVEEAEATIFEVRDSHVGTVQLVHGGQAAVEYVEWVDEHPNGIETGLADLDALTGGLLPGNLVIIAGRTHMGKTALGLQFLERICETKPGLMFSLESQRREMAGRLIEWHKHRLGRDAAVDRVFKLQFFIDDSSRLSPGMMRARLRRMKRQHGLSVVVVDYLQLMEGKGDSREQEVAYISRQLKAIAKEFQVPVIALAQLNRKVEERIRQAPAHERPSRVWLHRAGCRPRAPHVPVGLLRPGLPGHECRGRDPRAEESEHGAHGAREGDVQP